MDFAGEWDPEMDADLMSLFNHPTNALPALNETADTSWSGASARLRGMSSPLAFPPGFTPRLNEINQLLHPGTTSANTSGASWNPDATSPQPGMNISFTGNYASPAISHLKLLDTPEVTHRYRVPSPPPPPPFSSDLLESPKTKRHTKNSRKCAEASLNFDMPAASSSLSAAAAVAVRVMDEKSTLSPVLQKILNIHEKQNDTAPKHVKPKGTINFARETLGPTAWAPLSRPLVSQDLVVVGTENSMLRGPTGYKQIPGLVMCDMSGPFVRGVRNQPLKIRDSNLVVMDSAILDLQWIEPGHSCLCATETSINVVSCLEPKVTSLFKQPHVDRIRQLAVHPQRTKFCSGGNDERIAVTALDAGSAASSFMWNTRTEGIVGSVAWHPADNFVVTYTLDSGMFGFVDTRSERIALKYDVGRGGLYTHLVVSDYYMALGFGNGAGSLVDVRYQGLAPICVWQDPILSAIGEFIIDSSKNDVHNVVATGIGGISFVDFDAGRGQVKSTGVCSTLEMYKDVPLAPGSFKTSGAFIPNQSSVFMQTDAAGYVALFDAGTFRSSLADRF